MPATMRYLYAGTPSTTRGVPTFLNASPDGRKMIYPNGNSIVIRDLQNPLDSDVFQAHNAAATVARFAPAGNWVASADAQGNLKIWDSSNPEKPIKMENRILSSAICDVAWTPDSTKIAVVGDGRETFGRVITWDSGNSVGDIAGHTKKVLSCDMRPARPMRLATGSEDATCGWAEGPPFKYKTSMKEHNRAVNCIRFSPDGARAASIGEKKIVVYDGESGAKVAAWEAHSGTGMTLSWSPDGRQILSCGLDKTARVFDVQTQQCILDVAFNDRGTFDDQQVGTLWAGGYLMSLSTGGDLSYLDTRQPTVTFKLQGHNKPIKGLAVNPAHRIAYTGASDGAVCRWDEGNGYAYGFVGKAPASTITGLALAGGYQGGAAESVLVTSLDNTLRSVPTATSTFTPDTLAVKAPLCVSPINRDPLDVVVGTPSSLVRVRSNRIVQELQLNYEPRAIDCSPYGNQIAVAGSDSLVHIYSVQGDRLAEEGTGLRKHRAGVTCVAYSPDGQRLLSSDQSKESTVWLTNGWQVEHGELVAQTARINCAAWAPDSRRFVTGSLDRSAVVWQVADPYVNQILLQFIHVGGVVGAAFLDDHTLITAGADMMLKTWALS
eukprot:tig00020554_g10939.t1